MFSREDAMAAVERTVAGTAAEACVKFNEDWIVRVDYEEDGINYDPFFKVNSETGEVIDFAIMPYLTELTPLFQAEDEAKPELGHSILDDLLDEHGDNTL